MAYFKETFESGNSFSIGRTDLVTRPATDAKNGSYKLNFNPNATHALIVKDEVVARGSSFKMAGWIKTNSDYTTTGLTGFTFGVPDDIKTTNTSGKGYQVCIDVRNNATSSPSFQIRKDTSYTTPVGSNNSYVVSANTWYWLEVTWDSSGLITGKLHDVNKSLLMTVTGTDNTYTTGMYGLYAYGSSSFDDIEQGIQSGEDVTPPANVTSLAETHDSASATLTWINPTDTDFSYAKVYKDNVLLQSNVTSGTYTASSLTASTAYSFKVTTVDTTGNESAGSTISVTTDSVANPSPSPSLPASGQIITDGLVGYWHYAQGVNGTTWENIAPNTKGLYNGTITGATVQSDGMYFDGVDDKFVTYDNYNLPQHSIELYISPNEIKQAWLYYFGEYSLSNKNPTLVLDGNNKRLVVQDYSTSGTITNSQIAINNFYHIVTTYDGVGYKVYLNGNYEGIYITSTDGKITNAFNIGNVQGVLPNAKYSFIRMYSKALTPTEISQNYSAGTEVGLPPPEIVTDGLVGYWHYGRGVSGSTWSNIAPDTKGQHNGAITGATLQSDGMYFDGVDDYVEISNIPENTQYTLEIWAKGSKGTPMSTYVNSDDTRTYYSGNTVVYQDSTGKTVTYQTAITNYNQIVATFNGSTMSLYVNGVLRGTNNNALIVTTVGNKIYLGSVFYGSNLVGFLEGAINHARVYSRALTDQEITQNYSAGTEVGLPPPEIVTDGLVGYWHYGRGVSGSTWSNIAPDTKGQHNGAITGATLQSDGMYFDGVDDYVKVNSTNALTNSTIEIGIIPETISNVGYIVTDSVKGFNQNGTNYLRYFGNSHQNIKLLSLSNLNISTITSDTVNKTFYNNGVKGSTYSDNTSFWNNYLNFGSYDSSSSRWKGKIVFIRIYNRKLTDSEVSYNYSFGTDIGLNIPPDSTPPADITSLTATNTTSSITLNWTNPTDEDFSKVKIYRDNTFLAESTGTSYTDNTAVEGIAYTYKVTSLDTTGNESTGVIISKTIPNTAPPSNVTSLTASNSTTNITLNWTNPTDKDFSKVNIYRNNVYLTESTGTSFIDNNVVKGLAYTYKLTSVDLGGLESTGSTAIARIPLASDNYKSESGKYLQMDGIDDYITANVTFNKIEMDFAPELKSNTVQYYFYGLGASTGAYAIREIDGNDTWSTYWNNWSINGTLGAKDTPLFNTHGRYSLIATGSSSSNCTSLYVFSQDNMSNFLKGKIYSIKLYLDNVLVAHYDMSSGTVLDQSGNGNHATLVGGEWKNRTGFLQMDGKDDYLRTPAFEMSRIVIDADISTEQTNGFQTLLDGSDNGLGLNLESFTSVSDNIIRLSSWTTLKVDNVATTAYTKNKKTVFELESSTVFTPANGLEIFANNNGTANLKGKLYSVKIYNGTTLVAHYDMTTGTVYDQSGNGNHATLYGGQWASVPYLRMDGINDTLRTSRLTANRVIIDAQVNDFILTKTGNKKLLAPSSDGNYSVNIDNGLYSFTSTNMALYTNNSNITVGASFETHRNKRVLFDIKYNTTVTSDYEIFHTLNTQHVGSKAYNIKFYNGNTLVAHFDFTTGTLTDQTGNGNTLTNNGGTFVTKPIANVQNVKNSTLMKTATLYWEAPPSDSDFDKYKIYKENVLLGEVIDNTFEYTAKNLTNDVKYVFKITTVDTMGNESDGTIVVAMPTSTGTYLWMDGVDDYLRTPANLQFTRVVMEFTNRHRDGIRNILSSASNQLYIYKDANNKDFLVGFNTYKINGVEINPSPAYDIISNDNSKLVIDLSSNTLLTDTLTFFANNSGIRNLETSVYNIKIYNDDSLVAHYDMSTGTVEDQSGNGNHGILNGGEWVRSNMYLRMNSGLSNIFIQTPALTFTEVVVDAVYYQPEITNSLYYYDFRDSNNTASPYCIFYRDSSNKDSSLGLTTYVDGVQFVNNTSPNIQKGKRTTLRSVANTTLTRNYIHFFSNHNKSQPVIADVYDIKVYNGTTLVAHYDMSTGTVNDQSGNNNHGILGSNTTWVNDNPKGYALYMDGVDDRLETPHVYFDEIVLDGYFMHKSGVDQYYWDGRHNYGSSEVYREANGNDWIMAYNINIEYFKVNNELITTYRDKSSIPSKQRVVMNLKYKNTLSDLANGTKLYIFNRYTGTELMQGYIFNIKLYKQGILVAHYDTSTGNVLDLSGNGNHGVLTGGTFVGKPAPPTTLTAEPVTSSAVKVACQDIGNDEYRIYMLDEATQLFTRVGRIKRDITTWKVYNETDLTNPIAIYEQPQFIIKGLDDNTLHHVKMSSYTFDEGDLSNDVQVTTDALPSRMTRITGEKLGLNNFKWTISES